MKTGNIWEDFAWTVASDYCWIETPLGLALRVAPGAKAARQYRPLVRGSAGLFREFAALETTPEAILEFARRYGCLGPLVQRVILDGRGWRIPSDLYPPGGIFATGFAERGGASRFVEPFDCERDPGEIIAWSWKSQILLMARFIQWLGGSPSDARTRVAEEHDTVAFAQHINAILAATIAPRVTPTGGDRRYRFRFEPRSLLGAMWLQAAQAAAEGVTFRQCATCGRPIAIAKTTGARSDAKFCSDACKSRGYRSRQARAAELAAKGWTPARISKELVTTTATVRRWIN